MKYEILQEYKRYSTLIIFALFIMILASCKKTDDYKKLITDQEISYPGRLDSIKVFSGNNRVMLKGTLTADPKVKEVRVFWNGLKDSVSIPVTSGIAKIEKIINIKKAQEGAQNFTIYSYDSQGNKSIATFAPGRTYGDRYQASLQSINIASAGTNETTGLTVVNFVGVDKLSGVFATDVTYTKLNETLGTLRVPVDSSSVLLPNFKYGSDITYKTLFLPDSTSIDTFSVSLIKNIPKPPFIKVDITNNYLKNAGGNIQHATWDGTRRGLPADWITSASAKNFSGDNLGGYQLRNGVGYLLLESGYGARAIDDGMIYQTITLPAGSYAFEAEVSQINSGALKYIVAANGTTLPPVSKIPTSSLAYANMDSASKIAFILTATTQVSIGMAVTFPATSFYVEVAKVRLYSIVNL